MTLRYFGVIDGMSWESTAEYYRLLNRGVAERLGGLHSAPLLLHSVDFAEIATLQQAGAWGAAGDLLARAARGLEQAGAGPSSRPFPSRCSTWTSPSGASNWPIALASDLEQQAVVAVP